MGSAASRPDADRARSDAIDRALAEGKQRRAPLECKVLVLGEY